MITTITFKVELDYLAAERGLDTCVEVDCAAEVSFTYDRFDKPEINIQWFNLKSVVDENDKEVLAQLSAIDLEQINNALNRVIDNHDFYDDYISVMEAKAERAMEDT